MGKFLLVACAIAAQAAGKGGEKIKTKETRKVKHTGNGEGPELLLLGFTSANIDVRRLAGKAPELVAHAKLLNGRYLPVPNKPNCWELVGKTYHFELQRIGANYALYGYPSPTDIRSQSLYPGCRVKIVDYNHSLREWLVWPIGKAVPGVSLTKVTVPFQMPRRRRSRSPRRARYQ